MNRKYDKQITYQGESHTMKRWADIIGISHKTFQNRFYAHHGNMDLVTSIPVRKGGSSYFYKGKWYSAREIAKLNGTITATGVRNRRQEGWTVEQIVETPYVSHKERGSKKKKPEVVEENPKAEPIYTVPCADCIYHDRTGPYITCGYILVEHHGRPCPPPKEDRPCTARVVGKSVRQKITLEEWSSWTTNAGVSYNTWN